MGPLFNYPPGGADEDEDHVWGPLFNYPPGGDDDDDEGKILISVTKLTPRTLSKILCKKYCFNGYLLSGRS